MTPVEVSLWVTDTALTSGLSFRHFLRTSRSIVSPKGKSRVITSAPNAEAMSVKRFPKTPTVALTNLSPGERVLTTAASMAAVPEPVMTHTSPSVSNTRLSRSVVLSRRSLYSGPRWLIIGLDISSSMSGGTGMGPGMRRFTVFPPGSVVCPSAIGG